MIDFSDFATEIFQILRAYCQDIVLYDEEGARVYEPTEARRMYVLKDNILVSIKEDGDNSALKLYLSPSIGLGQLTGFIETLRTLAAKSNLLFHVKRFNKEIKPQDFATKASLHEQEKLNMNLMEGMYGTSKSSYLKLENARMIVRHSERVKENMIGSRGRHIQSIFVENAQGERFLFPVNILSGARAMTQHVNQGGSFADEVGQQIIRMAQDFRNLAQVATKESAVDAERFGGLRESVLSTMKSQKRSFARMSETKYYARECERVLESANLMEGEEDLSGKIEMLESILGEGMDQTVLLSVARLVNLPEAAQIVETDDGMDGDDMESDDGDAEGEDDGDVEPGLTEAPEEVLAPENNVVRGFTDWMESFDPDSVLEGKSFKRNDDDEEDVKDKRKEDKQKREEKKDKKKVDEAVGAQPGDRIVYTAVEESPPGTYQGTIKAISGDQAQVEWLGHAPKNGGSTVPLNNCRTVSEINQTDAAAAQNGVQEGKSFKRNDDDEEQDVKAKRKEDKEKRDEKKDKKDLNEWATGDSLADADHLQAGDRVAVMYIDSNKRGKKILNVKRDCTVAQFMKAFQAKHPYATKMDVYRDVDAGNGEMVSAPVDEDQTLDEYRVKGATAAVAPDYAELQAEMNSIAITLKGNPWMPITQRVAYEDRLKEIGAILASKPNYGGSSFDEPEFEESADVMPGQDDCADECKDDEEVLPTNQGASLKHEIGHEADDGQLERMRQLAGLRK